LPPSDGPTPKEQRAGTQPHTPAQSGTISCRLVSSIDHFVDRFAVWTQGERLAARSDRIAVVLGARIVPGPRPGRLLAIAFGDLPRRLERLRILDHHLRLERGR